MNDKLIDAEVVQGLCDEVFGASLHKKRRLSIALCALGAVYADEFSISGIGRGLARARGKSAKHGIKQVDRFLSNERVGVAVTQAAWARWVVGDRDSIVVAFDWTEFASDGQSCLALYLVTRHGRATPLLWRTVDSGTLKDNRNRHEDELLGRLYDALVDEAVEVTVLADRGFGDTALYAFLEQLGFHYVIRFRGGIKMTTEDGGHGKARDFLAPSGEATRYDNVSLTADKRRVPTVVTVLDKGMKDAWFLATDRPGTAQRIVDLYGRRFSIEETFRDTKDGHFGMGLKATHIGDPDRRDRLLLLAAIAHVHLTLLGRAGEELGMDRQLRANTERERRTHSLFRQGREYLRGMLVAWRRRLRRAFLRLLWTREYETEVYAWI